MLKGKKQKQKVLVKSKLDYYKQNCEEDYLHTPISVLRYISELEKQLKSSYYLFT